MYSLRGMVGSSWHGTTFHGTLLGGPHGAYGKLSNYFYWQCLLDNLHNKVH